MSVQSASLLPVPTGRTTVSVLADDPVTYAGIAGQLRAREEFELIPWRSEQLPAVTVVAADSMTPDQLTRVEAVHASGRSRVVAIVGEIDGPALLATVEAGACVIVRRREATNERLAEAVRVAAAGDGSLPSDLLGRLFNHVGNGGRAATAERSLTHREVRVLRLLADGYSTAEIAGELAYSESTIKSAIHELTSRLELRNRSHAVAFAVRAGLI
jgi:DNA-binding NarL/FixJ family response regulator